MRGNVFKFAAVASALAVLLGFAACSQQSARTDTDDEASASDSASVEPSAGSGEVVEKLTPKIVSATLDALNIKYAIESDPRGYPMIVVDPTPFPVRQFNILFFSCDTVEAQCDDIALWSWYDLNGAVSERAIYAWNDPFQARRWSTAYVDKDNDPALVMNINATGGLGERNLQILVNTFVEDMFAFHDLLKEEQVSSNEPAPSAPSAAGYVEVDSEVADLTEMIKEFGAESYSRAKQADKKS